MNKKIIEKQVKAILSGSIKRTGKQYRNLRWLIHHAETNHHYKLYHIYKSYSYEKERAFDRAYFLIEKRFNKENGYKILNTLVWGNTSNFTICFKLYDILNECYFYLIWNKCSTYYIIDEYEI